MTTDERIDKLTSMIEARFNAIDARFDAVDARFENSEARFSRLDDYLLQFRGEMIRRLDVVDQRLDYLSNGVVNMDMRMAAMGKVVLDFGVLAGQLTREQARAVDTSNDLATRVAILEEKMSRLLNPAA